MHLFSFYINYHEVIVLNISIEEFKKRLFSKDLNIIDTRNKYKYMNGTIYKAINIEENELLYNHLKYLKRNEEYYLLCDHGFSSLRLSKMLNSLGYKTYSIKGGYDEYILEK